MEIKICENIKRLRKDKNISQEVLANKVNVSVQAVSKWETGQSLPDISVLPEIAEFFGISMNELFFGSSGNNDLNLTDIPSDGNLYIVQVKDGKVLGRDLWEKDRPISISSDLLKKVKSELNIWGSVIVNGDVYGNISSEEDVTCSDVHGVIAAEGNVTAGDVSGSVSSNGSAACGDIGESLSANGSVSCGDIGGKVCSNGEIHCKNIEGDIYCSCPIYYDN